MDLLNVLLGIDDAQTGQSSAQFGHSQSIGGVFVKVAECTLKFLQLSRCEIGVLPGYNL